MISAQRQCKNRHHYAEKQPKQERKNKEKRAKREENKRPVPKENTKSVSDGLERMLKKPTFKFFADIFHPSYLDELLSEKLPKSQKHKILAYFPYKIIEIFAESWKK